MRVLGYLLGLPLLARGARLLGDEQEGEPIGLLLALTKAS